MKKRKPPIVLVTLMIVMLAVVAVMNAPRASQGHDHASHQGQEDPEVTGQPREADSKDAVAERLKAPARPSMSGAPDEEGPTQPTIVGPRNSRPEPNPTATTSQWYND
jgi:hypothetical protein